MKYDESHLLNKLPAKTYQKDKELQGDFMLLDFFLVWEALKRVLLVSEMHNFHTKTPFFF